MLNVLLQKWKRMTSRKPGWLQQMDTKPVSDIFGLDRGTPIDRYYIERFLEKNKALVKGKALEIAESTYTQKYDSGVTSFEVLHVDPKDPKATIIGDLSNPESLPENAVDCFICTQTLNFIYDFKSAIRGIHKMLKKDGVALITLGGISQISRYDMDRWGDYWRFTELSALTAFAESFEKENIQVDFHGNVFSCVCFLEGICVEEIDAEKLNIKDRNYQMLITIVAKK